MEYILSLELRLRQRGSNGSHPRLHDDTDLRATIRRRSSSRHSNQTSNHEDREYLLDKDYRQTSIFDRLLSLISPNNNTNNKKLLDNYDIQQMDIVDDYPIPVPPLPSMPPPPPPLPPSHLPFFDPLPPLPPPPPSIFNMFPVNQSLPLMDWPRPNFVPHVQTDLWTPTFNNSTDIDLRHQPIPHHHSTISPRMTVPKKAPQMKRKRSKKRYEKRKSDPSISRSIPIEKPSDPPVKPINEDDEEEERLLREQLLSTLSSKRKVKIVEPINPEPDRIVTIILPNSPAPVVPTAQTPPVVNKSVEITSKSQYSINQRYKRVKANVSATNLTSKTETVNTTTTTTVVRTTQPIIQTRNKIVRVVMHAPLSLSFLHFLFLFQPETDIDLPQTNPVIVTFDEPNTDEDEHQIIEKTPPSICLISDEERQAIKRLQQPQDEVIRRSNAIESSTKSVPPKAPSQSVQTIQEAIPSTDELSALFEKR